MFVSYRNWCCFFRLLEANDGLVFLLKFHHKHFGKGLPASDDRPAVHEERPFATSLGTSWTSRPPYGQSNVRGSEYSGVDLKTPVHHEGLDYQRQGSFGPTPRTASTLMSSQGRFPLSLTSNTSAFRSGLTSSSLASPFPPNYPTTTLHSYVPQPSTMAEAKESTDGPVRLVPPLSYDREQSKASLLSGIGSLPKPIDQPYPLLGRSQPAPQSLMNFSQQMSKLADAAVSNTEDGGRLNLLADAAANSNRS